MENPSAGAGGGGDGGPVDGKVEKEAPAGGRRVVEPGRRSSRPPDRASGRRKRQRAVTPGEILTANIEAALAGCRSLNDIDRRTVRVVAAIAVEHGAEREALDVARMIGRTSWPDALGGVLRQRFVDALDDVGLGDDAVPERWQSLRRSEAVRVDLRPKVPPPAGHFPDVLPAEAFRHNKRRP